MDLQICRAVAPCPAACSRAWPSLVLHGKPPAAYDYLTAAELRDCCARANVQVVVLNSCWGARTSAHFPGLAHTLAAPVGPAAPGPAVPVVVAHQMPIPQASAAGFAGPFYQNLALACAIEDGVQTFRGDCLKNPFAASVPDWGIPVVFLSVADSALFHSDRVDPYPLNFGEFIGQHLPLVGRQFLRDRVDARSAETRWIGAVVR